MTGLRKSLRLGSIACLAAVTLCGIVAAVNHQAIATGQTSSTPAPAPAEPRFAVVGDSYTGGSNEGGFPPNGWPNLFLNGLAAAGTPAIADVSGRGGSGYVQRGPEGTVFGEEVSRVVKPDDRLVVFFGGLNDGQVPLGRLTVAANAAYEAARQIAPTARLLVIGPVWPRPDPPPAIFAMRDVLATATKAHGGEFVDPVAEGWLWDRPDVIGADNVHPTDAGHQLLSQLIGAHIAPLLR